MTRTLSVLEVDMIAAAAHEVNRRYAQLLGDDSHQPWDSAPEWQKVSARAGILGVAENNYTPEQQHDAWCAHKRATGWVRGDKKNEYAKTHPSLVPYAELSSEEKYKDTLFSTTVKAMLDGMWRVPT